MLLACQRVQRNDRSPDADFILDGEDGTSTVAMVAITGPEGRSVVSNMATKTQVLSLYRMLLRESKQFPSYNYRTYALQRIKDAFRANRRIEDPEMVAKLAEEGHKTLALIKRQVNM
ncbi:unnamed protein product [Boreogadus saida]